MWWFCCTKGWAASGTCRWWRSQRSTRGRGSSGRRLTWSARAEIAALLAETEAGCPAGPDEPHFLNSAKAKQNQKKNQLQNLFFYYLDLEVPQSWSVTWQTAEGNSSRLLWLRSRRRRCHSCCWTNASSSKQDRESSSFPDRSSRWIRSLSLGRPAEVSPKPNTEEQNTTLC